MRRSIRENESEQCSRGSRPESQGFHVHRLTLNRKKNALSSENGGNEERIDTEVDNCEDAGGAGSW